MNNNLDNAALIAKAHPVSGEPETEQVWQEPADGFWPCSRQKPPDWKPRRYRRGWRSTDQTTPQPSSVRRGGFQFLARFGNPLIIILLIASAVSAATGDVASFVIIVLSSCSASFSTSSRRFGHRKRLRRCASRSPCRRPFVAMERVSRCRSTNSSRRYCRTHRRRSGPADARLLESRDLYVNQALLTGEPYPAEKRVSDAASGAENPAGTSNAVFAGTSVISGTAAILICGTGNRTALGHLATSLSEKPPATAFTIGIRRFGMLIMRFTILMVLFVLVVNIVFARPMLESLMFAVALAVGLTPELLPMIVTVTLARSAMQMAKRKVIVKRLSAIHDLGAMNGYAPTRPAR